jgi:hypothetical protein
LAGSTKMAAVNMPVASNAPSLPLPMAVVLIMFVSSVNR